ncbi:tRNA-i(6)A37 methylthiotransferase [Patulibacter medicamentivorans]|uniref:tRNA-2-methylthio-N(6)-dimethylallyladenosine synthase n=1 Tax=Patulibacter medicamentivorans TaxID=1097667 RepID=H0E2U0_9ACTN|nr:tRNA (N6-isopentenyl adenosine(37)-C2)-methylthiotransferase MiaB [Patulibacter medicamentivorans]EHN12018.1 tRNA-i(6)A37 methylthiotransferase [Patulibacter medicamentivorans]
MASSDTPKRYHVTTFGCQMNEHDSERMRGMLESLGYGAAETAEDADLILFNTCSIRESADSRFLAHLGHAKRMKKERPGVVVGVGGCWAQSVKDEVFARFPFVDVAFGPGQINKLAEFLTADSLSAQGYFEFEGFPAHLPTKRDRSFQAWVQIAVGCNLKCSYCIVPSTRGRESSRPFEQLLDEVRALAADGVREVTLLGQNVNAYGRDLRTTEPLPEALLAFSEAAKRPTAGTRPRTFAELLTAVAAVDGIERIRYTSPHPKDIREDVVAVHAALPEVCQHIHLPLQAGSSRILKRMRRTYDKQRYLDRVAMIREQCPDIAITTDIIVGFPGETEAEFEETLEVVDAVAFDGAFTFVFSPRRGTEAAELVDDFVPHPVKVERMERLVERVQHHARERTQRFVGRTLEVLIEGESRTDPDKLRGRTSHNKVVNFVGFGQPGETVPVQITGATSQTLSGEMSLLATLAG